MSYIAKVHLLKMFPKKGDDAIHIEDDWLVVPFVNILNPITANNPPADAESLINSFELVGDEDIPIAGRVAPDAPVKMVWNGEEYTAENFTDLNGKILAQNQKVIFYFKNPGWAAGEDHKLTLSIIQERPIKFTLERTIN
jgi:hypothetical protein